MIILRQKEYNLASDLKYSGIKRTLKKNIGRARKKIAGRLDKSISKDLKEQLDAEDRGWRLGNSLHNITNPKDVRREVKELKSKDKIVVKQSSGLGSIPKRKLILIPPNYNASLGEVYHELGHIKNYEGENGRLPKIASKYGQSKSLLNGINILSEVSRNPYIGKRSERELIKGISPGFYESSSELLNASGIPEAVKRWKEGNLLLIDERQASKWGLKHIKNKVSEDILKLETERQNIANKTYKKAVSSAVKIPIRNKIQIPSRRGDFNLNQSL